MKSRGASRPPLAAIPRLAAGKFVSDFLVLLAVHGGLATRLEVFEVGAADAALAGFADRSAAPRTGGTHDPFAVIAKPTLVTTAMDRWLAAYDAGFETGRWERMRPLCAPGYVFDDRRRFALLQGDIELMLASLRERAATGARDEWTVVGAAGERIAVGRMLWSGGPPDGRFEIEDLGVVELDDDRAARRDAWARWAAIEPHVAPWPERIAANFDAFEACDRAGMRRVYGDDLVVEDHRRTGFGRIEVADA